MSDFYAQLSSILQPSTNETNQLKQQQQQQQTHHRQQQPVFELMRQQQHQQPQQQQQNQKVTNILSTMPLPLLSQLPTYDPAVIAAVTIEQQQNINRGIYQQKQQQQQQSQQRGDTQQKPKNEPPSNTDTNLNINTNESKLSAEFNYLPGTASLIEYIDKQLMIILRDGRKLIGYLRSIDQFGNLLLSSTIERIHVGTKYGDIPRGIYMIRGENVVLLGEVDFQTPLKVQMTRVSVEEILELQRIEKKKQEEADKAKKKALLERCLIPQTDAILDEYY